MSELTLNEKKTHIERLAALFRSSWFVNDRNKISDAQHKENIANLLKNLEGDAYERCLNLVNKLEKTYSKKFVPLKEIYTQDELEQLQSVKTFEKEPFFNGECYQWKNYKLPINLFETSVFYYKHGLDLIDNIKDIVGDKAIIDVGANIADSALIFRDFFPESPIYSFEPVYNTYKYALKTLELNNIKNIKLENIALGNNTGESKMFIHDSLAQCGGNKISDVGTETVKIDTLDNYVAKNKIRVGVIKVDIEGFEQEFLKGAINTIKEQKPVLLISIYHSYDDFYKIKPMIESWVPEYKFDFVQGVQNNGIIAIETLLVAVPK